MILRDPWFGLVRIARLALLASYWSKNLANTCGNTRFKLSKCKFPRKLKFFCNKRFFFFRKKLTFFNKNYIYIHRKNSNPEYGILEKKTIFEKNRDPCLTFKESAPSKFFRCILRRLGQSWNLWGWKDHVWGLTHTATNAAVLF